MKITGSFKNVNNDIISIIIVNKSSPDGELNIDNSDDVFFAEDPISISYDIENSFETNITRLCTVRLLTTNYLGDILYANNEYDVVINVFANNKCIFAGYVEPNIYSQQYSEKYNELEINCTDYIATLQHNDILHDRDYDTAIKNAKIKTYNEYFADMGLFKNDLDLVSNNESKIWYDNSKEVYKSDIEPKLLKPVIFDTVAVNELLFLADEESSVYNNFDLLHELLQYLDLHICQVGYDFYIFSWESVRNTELTNLVNIRNQAEKKQINFYKLTIAKENYASDDTNITLDEVYNQIQLTCDIEDIDTVIESPLAEESLKSPYNAKQLYVQEIGLHGNKNWFKEFCTGDWSSYGFVVRWTNAFDKDIDFLYDWYMRLMNNNNWTFLHKVDGVYKNVYEDLGNLPVDAETGQLCDQHKMFEFLKLNSLTPALLSFGKTGNIVESGIKRQPEGTPGMTSCLVMSINGNGHDEENLSFPNATDLENNASVITYNNKKFVQLSPIDNSVINYIVFSGEILLQPIQKYSGLIRIGQTEMDVIPVQTDKGERWYDQLYWTKKFPNSDKGHRTQDVMERYLAPPTDLMPKELEYNFSSEGSTLDTVYMLDVFECELKIGDKYLCELPMRNGKHKYVWRKEGEFPTVQYKDTPDGPVETYEVKTFTIGFDPTIGDFIIGKKYPIANTVTIDMNIGDVKGLAIPITAEDKLSGELSFKILGPVNTVWKQVTRRHPTWFRKTKWWTDAIPILPHVENIFLNDFECKIYTNNGNINNEGENDLIYTSDEQTKYINKKDDITFKINTALSADESFKYGVKNAINLSNAYCKDEFGDFGLLRQLDDIVKGTLEALPTHAGKPEELYIESYYNEYKMPRLIMECTLFDKSHDLSTFIPFYSYFVNMTQSKFNLMGADTSLKYCTSAVKLKNCNFY